MKLKKELISQQKAYILVIGNDIHIIGGYDRNTHFIYNLQTKSLELIHTFEQFESMLGIALVHIKSQNVILLIGGSCHYNYMHCHRFCLKTQKWKEIDNIKFEFYGGSAMLTKDEKHIIVNAKFQGGSDQRNEIGIIDVIDKDKYEIRLKEFSSPTKTIKTSKYMTITGGLSNDKNELLIAGFVRQYKDEISKDVIGIVCTFCNDALIHCIRVGENVNEHFVMPVQELLK